MLRRSLFRSVALLVLGVASAAQAHSVIFEFVVPEGTGNRTDGGHAVLQWTDSADPLGSANVELKASRRAYPPYQTPDAGGDIAITSSPISINHPANVYMSPSPCD